MRRLRYNSKLDMSATPMEITLKTWEEVTDFFSRDLGKLTMFVATPSPPAIGSILPFTLKGPTGLSLPLQVRVIEHNPDGRQGMRVALQPIEPQDNQRLADWLAESKPEEPAPPPPPPPPPPLPSALTAPREQVDAMLEQLTQILDRYKRRDAFAILGLASHEGIDEVKASYAKLVRAYHPHRFARMGPQVRKVATQIFVLVQRAHKEALEIVETRTHEKQVGPRRRVGPREGRNLEEHSVSQALSLLDLSQYDAARAVLDDALQRDPSSARVKLHRILVDAREQRAAEHAKAAAASYRKILEIDPRHEEALLYVEKMEEEARDSGKGGFLKRLVKGARD
jgi:tetratricopeptide (TPR) repeat protein